VNARTPNPITLLNEFKAFLLRGNAVDLAVAVVVGAAFKSIVDALVADFITPLVAAIGGKQDFSALDFTVHNSTFRYGDFINQALSFVIIAAVVFFAIVVPVNTLMARAKKEPPVDPTSKKCPECLSEIPLDARRCAFCTTALAA
jgi:large conductance mechanosensitive channel